MTDNAYSFIEDNEDNHWWFKARLNIIKQFLLQNKSFYNNVLDIGCGSGHFLKNIKDISENRKGIDSHLYKIPYAETEIGDAMNLCMEDSSIDLITMLDVLEHIEHPEDALKEVHRVLKEDGTCLITVPALQFLYSPHDKDHNHFKRYYKKDLIKLFKDNHFEIKRCSYFNTILFPIEATIRLLEKLTNKNLTQNDKKTSGLNKILFNIFNLETKLLKNHNLPIGLSLIIVVKPI